MSHSRHVNRGMIARIPSRTGSGVDSDEPVVTAMALARRPTIVGRGREVAQLRSALEAARAGDGTLIFIGGEAGVGKTAVVTHFMHEAASDARIFLGHSYDQDTRPLYGPWLASGLLTEPVTMAAEDSEAPDLSPQRQRVLDFLARNGSARPGQVAIAIDLSPNSANQLLRRMLRDGQVSQPGYGVYDLDPANLASCQSRQSSRQSWSASDQGSGDPLEPYLGRSPEIVARGVLETLRGLCAGQPLVVILEDLHWADETSLQLLRAVSRELDRLAVLIICTYRDIELDEGQPLYLTLPTLLREPNVRNITLPLLAHDDVRCLVRTRYVLASESETRLAHYLDRYAGGNPLFIDELLRTLEIDRILAPAESGWALAELPHFQVPPLLRQILDAQLRLLASDDRRLLQLAAVIGEEIPIELWSEVAGVPEEELSPTVERAIEARLIEETPGRQALRFRHALIREQIYARVVLPGRRAWHRRAGRGLSLHRQPPGARPSPHRATTCRPARRPRAAGGHHVVRGANTRHAR